MQIYGAPEGTRGCNRLFFINFFIIIILFFLVPSRGIKCLFFDQ